MLLTNKMQWQSIKSFNLPENTENEQEISIKLNTIPKFLIFKDGKVANIIEYIKDAEDDLTQIIKENKKLDKKELSLLYFAFNKKFQNLLSRSEKMGFDPEVIIDQYLTKINLKIKNVVQEINKIKSNTINDIKNFQQKINFYNKNNVKVGKLKKELLEIKCVYKKTNLDTIFNQIKLISDKIPFIIYKNKNNIFFKIYKYYSPEKLYLMDENWYYNLEEWREFVIENNKLPEYRKYFIESLDDNRDKYEKEQFLYKWMIAQQKLYKNNNLSFLKEFNLIQYDFPLDKNNKEQITIKYLDNKEYKNIEIYIDHNIEKLVIKFIATNNINRDKILSDIQNIFTKIKLDDPVINEIIVTSSIDFELKNFYNKYILLDLISNNEYFAKYLYINEFDKVNKRKENTIWVYFKTIPKCEYGITISITNSKINNNIVGLKIKKTTQNRITDIIRVMRELFSFYTTQKDKIIKFYKNYIKDFPYIKKIYTKKNIKGVKEFDKELFPTSYYARTCQKKFQPTINYINSEKLDSERSFIFPKDIPSKIPQKYTCTNSNFPWPGLKKLSSKIPSDKLLLKGYVPCCYAIQGSNYKRMQKYLKEGIDSIIDSSTKIKKQTNIKETNHFIIKGETKKFNFKLLGAGDFWRKGFAKVKTISNVNSFLYCIYYIFRDRYDNLAKYYEENNFSKLEEFFNKERLNYSKDQKLIALTKQELYDKTNEEISNIIRDYKQFFDPNLFINILSSKFDCNIFLFEKINNKIQLKIPRHIYGYYHNFNNDNCVLIYLNKGSKSSNNLYPQCEIIGIKNKDNELETIIENDNKLYNKIINLFNILTSNFVLSKKGITNQKFQVAQKYFLSQYFDINGKCRILNFKYLNVFGTLITSPIQPLELVENNIIEIKKIDDDIAIK